LAFRHLSLSIALYCLQLEEIDRRRSPSIVVYRDLHGYLSKSIMMPPKARGSFNYNRDLRGRRLRN
jgi:hypothetical protein